MKPKKKRNPFVVWICIDKKTNEIGYFGATRDDARLAKEKHETVKKGTIKIKK